MPEKLYTLAETAEIFRVSKNTLFRWIKIGKLVAIKLPGGKYRVTEKAINTILQN